MMTYYENELAKLEAILHDLPAQTTHPFEEIETGIKACTETLQTIRNHVCTAGFTSIQQECLFFKTIKPTVTGYLLGYLIWADIEKGCPVVHALQKEKYLTQHIEHLQNYFTEHQEVYEYMVTGRTHRDTEYFARNCSITSLHPHTVASYTDSEFATAVDGIVARFKAHQWVIQRLYTKLQAINPALAQKAGSKQGVLQWTGNKVDLIELLYALYASRVCNQGNATLKEIAESFQHMFNVQLGAYYRTYLEIQIRKNSRTRFLDSLKQNLIDRMEQAEGI